MKNKYSYEKGEEKRQKKQPKKGERVQRSKKQKGIVCLLISKQDRV